MRVKRSRVEQLIKLLGPESRPKIEAKTHNVNIHLHGKHNQYMKGALFIVKAEQNYEDKTQELINQSSPFAASSKNKEPQINVLIWIPYTSLLTINKELILHEKSTGGFITARTLESMHRSTPSKNSLQKPPQQENIQTNYISAEIDPKNNQPQKYRKKHTHTDYAIIIPLIELESIKKFSQKLGWSSLVLSHKGNVHKPLFFHDGGMHQFISELQKYVHMETSLSDPSLLLIKDIDEPRAKALITMDYEEFFSIIYKKDSNKLYALSNKITNDLKRMVKLQPKSRKTQFPKQEAAKLPKFKSHIIKREEVEGAQDDVFQKLDQIETPVTEKSYKEFEPDMKSTAAFELDQSKALTKEDVHSYMNEQGQFENYETLLQLIFAKGITEEARPILWPFLLGVYAWESTKVEREQLYQHLKEEYAIYTQQWQSITKRQERYQREFVERRSIIDKDVVRTDRTIPYYKEEGGEGLTKLRKILMAYGMYNGEVGYCQGMSDLCTPILDVCRDEVLSFWCFHEYMEEVQGNFKKDQKAINAQLNNLLNMIKTLNYPFYTFLTKMQADNLFFVYRWILIRFKREFPFSEIKRLWEACWTQTIPNFHLFFVYGVLYREKETLMQGNFNYDTILKHCIQISHKINLEEAMKIAMCALQDYLDRIAN